MNKKIYLDAKHIIKNKIDANHNKKTITSETRRATKYINARANDILT